MSIPALNWAFHQTLPRSSEKFILVALANYTNHQGTVWPSISRLAADTCQDRKTVIANIARLVEAGLLQDTGKRTGRTKSIPIYRLSGLQEMEQSLKRDTLSREAVPKTDGSSPVFPYKQSRKRDTEPLRNHYGNHKGGGKPPSILDLKDRMTAKELLLEEIRYDVGARQKRDQLRSEIKALNRQIAEIE